MVMFVAVDVYMAERHRRTYTSMQSRWGLDNSVMVFRSNSAPFAYISFAISHRFLSRSLSLSLFLSHGLFFSLSLVRHRKSL